MSLRSLRPSARAVARCLRFVLRASPVPTAPPLPKRIEKTPANPAAVRFQTLIVDGPHQGQAQTDGPDQGTAARGRPPVSPLPASSPICPRRRTTRGRTEAVGSRPRATQPTAPTTRAARPGPFSPQLRVKAKRSQKALTARAARSPSSPTRPRRAATANLPSPVRPRARGRGSGTPTAEPPPVRLLPWPFPHRATQL